MQHRDRIAIVGAGAAGLSAAYELRKRGYGDITLYDRRPRVGGKCLTEDIRSRPYEIGALIVGSPYDNVHELLEETGLATAPLDPVRMVDIDTPAPGLRQAWRWRGRVPLDLTRLAVACLKCRRVLSRQGFGGCHSPELAQCTFDQYLRQGRMISARPLVAPYYVGWGYGYLEQVAALYVLKLLLFYLRSLKKITKPAYRRSFMHSVPQGYQRLWEKIAAGFDLRLGTPIRSIRRTDKVYVTTAQGTRTFDKLVLACPLGAAAGFLDAGAEERLLFAKIKTLDFVTITCEVDSLPPHHLVFVTTNHTPLRPGRILSWYRRWKDSNICVLYMIGNPELTEERLVAGARADIARIGGVLGRIHRLDHWDYFPHVGPSDLAAGYFARLEALQGTRNTWYAGELLSFPTVEHVVAYSRHLVRTHFQGRGIARTATIAP